MAIALHCNNKSLVFNLHFLHDLLVIVILVVFFFDLSLFSLVAIVDALGAVPAAPELGLGRLQASGEGHGGGGARAAELALVVGQLRGVEVWMVGDRVVGGGGGSRVDAGARCCGRRVFGWDPDAAEDYQLRGCCV